ncbi:tachykinin-4 isoform X2 [Pelodiscus sinensis]|uniref:tachykinin-4 isoform X2 n=1 Tax=Pelodiscus sinensis TaxID=13735 RepID=UPI00070474A8
MKLTSAAIRKKEIKRDDMLSLEEDHQKAPSLKAAGLQSPSLQRFAELVKRGKFQQFYGLMGKRTSGHPGEKFIGLMGRRYSRGESTADGDNSQPILAWEP